MTAGSLCASREAPPGGPKAPAPVGPRGALGGPAIAESWPAQTGSGARAGRAVGSRSPRRVRKPRSAGRSRWPCPGAEGSGPRSMAVATVATAARLTWPAARR